MRFQKGQSGNPAGKARGTTNRVTREFRATIQTLLESNSDNVSLWLADVAGKDPSKALEHIARLAEYAAPKLTRAEVSGPNGGDVPLSVTITHVKPERTGS
jgi:hypothetical protein